MSEIPGAQNNWSPEIASFHMARVKGSHEGLNRSQVREKGLSRYPTTKQISNDLEFYMKK